MLKRNLNHCSDEKKGPYERGDLQELLSNFGMITEGQGPRRNKNGDAAGRRQAKTF